MHQSRSTRRNWRPSRPRCGCAQACKPAPRARSFLAYRDVRAAESNRKDNTNMNNETKTEFNQNAEVEINEIELETIAASLRVRSGLQAGLARSIQPCL